MFQKSKEIQHPLLQRMGEKVGSKNKFHCVCCNVDINGAGGGASDVLKLQNTLKGENQSKVEI